ncbi:beta glucan-binding protein [Fusarium pseudocircinatum]|uniref:Beta glucan-binding protein n=1 Tax=Fusarium pseudocircinatum TaxID=56676 RepID=A0A8H5P835_9HYPO|nr:beta glucan-binding protein [Fusarium pseudocircinatum]
MSSTAIRSSGSYLASTSHANSTEDLVRPSLAAQSSTESSLKKRFPQRPYFHSRRVKKGTVERPYLAVKDPRGIWITVIPAFGIVVGLLAIALLTWSGYKSVDKHQYCTVFRDDFSNGFNSTIWNKQVEVGGYGNGEFALTTDTDENVFVRDGQLIIKPTLQTDKYLSETTKINLTAHRTCSATTTQDCVQVANLTAGEIVAPVKSGRITPKNFGVIRYGRVEIVAKLAAGDWLLSQLMMFPAKDYYGAWPASGEIDIGMVRGNNYTYDNGRGNQQVSTQLHWGLDTSTDRWQSTSGARNSLRTTFHKDFHTFGLEWSDKYLFTWLDHRIAQVTYVKFNHPFYQHGGFHQALLNGSQISNPWTGPGTSNATPFDRPFYLIIALAVGGTSGWFPDDVHVNPPSTPGTARLICCRSARKLKFTTVSASFLSIAHLDKSGSSWDTHQLLICHVNIASNKRGSELPGFKKTFTLDVGLSNEARTQIEKLINGPQDEDPAISKHYLVGKYGTNVREIWAALATVTAYKYKAAISTTITPPTASNQSGSRSKRRRRSGPVPNYTNPRYSDSDSDEPGLTREDSQGSNYTEQNYTEQVRSKELPPEDSVVLLITWVLNLDSYCAQPFGAQSVVDFRTGRQKMSLRRPGVNDAIIAIDDAGSDSGPSREGS